MNVAQHVERGRALHPERPALRFEGREWTYEALDAAAGRAAAGLAALGVRPGDRVAILLPNVPEWAIAYLGAQKLGAVSVSINPGLTPAEAGLILADSGAHVAIGGGAARDALAAATNPLAERWVVADEGMWDGGAGDLFPAAELEPRAPSAIVYTSGTTGAPRGAVLSHANVVSNADAKRRFLGITPDDRLLLFLPLFHCFGQNAVFNAALQSGAAVVLQQRFDAAEVLASPARDGATMFFGVPTTFILLHDTASPADLGGYRYFFSAAAPLPVEIERAWESKFGRPIFQGYGLTETSPFASYNHRELRKPGSVGTPIDGVEMKVVDVEGGHDLPSGATGEIVIRGANVMLGYWNRPEESAAALRGGWFHTGDVGRMDEDGYFYLEDRVKDMINAGGMKVYPAEVENVLFAHPAVREAAVYGVPDPLMGERVCADVVLREGHEGDTAALAAFCRGRLAEYKAPRSVHVVEEIPRGATGKVLKRVLRERRAAETAAAHGPDRGPAGTPAAAVEWLVAWLAEELDVPADRVDLGRSLFDHGVSSSGAVRLALALGEWLGRPMQPTVAWSHPTVAALAAHLGAAARGSRDADVPADAHADLSGVSDADLAELLRAEIAASRSGRGR